MVIDFEHHYLPHKIWKKRGGKAGEIVRVYSEDGREILPLSDTYPNIDKHLADMDTAGIDMAVLSTTGLSLEDAKVFNDGCAEVVRQHPERLIGFALTAPLAKGGLDELERAVGELGLTGVTMTTQIDGRPVDSREMWPFYEKVAALDLPVFVHVSPAAPGFDACNAPYDLNRTLVREFDLMNATARFCLGGVLEEFPDLKFVVAHYGGGIHGIKERLERYVGYWGAQFWTEKPLISAPYLERFNEHFDKLYFTIAGREIGMATLKAALLHMSPKQLVFATDYPPNFVGNPTGMRTYIEKIRELDIGKEAIDSILSGNAAALLGLPAKS